MVLLKRDDREADHTEHTPAPVIFDKHDRLDKETTMSSFDNLDQAAAAIRKRDGCNYTTAYSAAAREHPDLYEKLQTTPVPEPMAKAATPAAVKTFEALAKRIAREEQVPMHKALRIAAAEFPAEFAAYQSA